MDIDTSENVQINNIVGSGYFDKDINLDKLEEFLRDSDEYIGTVEHAKEPPVSLRYYADLGEEIPLITFHRKGKYVVKGAKNIEQVKKAQNLAVAILLDTNLIEKPEDAVFEIQNVVAQDQIDQKINLINLSDVLDNSYYEGESYPALSYNPKEEPYNILFYSNGRMILSGCKNVDNIREVSEEFKEKINSFV